MEVRVFRYPTSGLSVFEKLKNSEIIFLIIVSLKSGMENSIIQELNAEVDRIILLFFFQLSFVSLSSQIMPHFVTKFVHETF